MNEKEYWLDRHRFLVIVIVLLIIWAGFMVFLYLKADEITKDPCGICAETMGDEVFCTFGKITVSNSRTYYPNGTVAWKDYYGS